MTTFFPRLAVVALLASGAAAQELLPQNQPAPPSQEPAQAGDLAVTVLVEEERAPAIAAGPLAINATFDAAVPPIASAVRNTNVVTITTNAAHGLTGCTNVTITGVTDASFNGTFTIASVGQTTFSYPQNGPNATSNGGQVLLAGATTAAERAIIQQAINEWQAIVQNSGSTTNPFPLSVRFTGFGAATCSNTLGITNTFVANMTGNLLFANMAFTTQANTFWEDPLNPPPGNLFDLLSVVRHELGHALGWTGGSVRVTNLLSTGAPIAAIASTNGAVRSANVVTITTTSPHGLAVGDPVAISGVADASFNGQFTVTAPVLCTTTNTFTYNQAGADAASGGGRVYINDFAVPRLNIPVVSSSGLHTAPGWSPNDLMVPCSAAGVRRPISLYPAASLVARGYQYVVPMQYVDASSVGTQDGTAVNPWQTVAAACSSSPAGVPWVLASETFSVSVPFQLCANGRAHVVNAARGGAVVNR